MSEPALDILLKEFDARAAGRDSARPSWLVARQGRAMTSFREKGIPHRRIEEWKYTDLRGALESRIAESPKLESLRTGDPFTGIDGLRLLIRDGRADGHMGEPPRGVELFDLAEPGDAPEWVQRNLGAVLSGDAMGEASLAMMGGGLAIRVAAETETPIHLRFLQRAEAIHFRLLIVLEQGASLSLLESHGENRGLANLGVEAVIGPNAQFSHVRLADAAAGAVEIGEMGIRIARDGSYRGHFSQQGARLSRVGLTIRLEGENAEAELSGTAVLGGKLHSDLTTHVEHVAGKTTSRQLFKNVAGGTSRAVYQGKITVHKGADSSDSRQTAKAILLGARAEADLKPELEILADDVKCAHGAAVGELDADSLFYLRSRGVPEMEARRLLISGFLEETVEGVRDDVVRAAAWKFIEGGLGKAQA